MNRRSLSDFGMRGTWLTVTNVLPMWKYAGAGEALPKNVLFIIEGAEPKTSMQNCCFPVFLSSECKRVCGPAFERLNTTMDLGMPDAGPYALGIGTSAANESGRITKPLKVRVTLGGLCEELSIGSMW